MVSEASKEEVWKAMRMGAWPCALQLSRPFSSYALPLFASDESLKGLKEQVKTESMVPLSCSLEFHRHNNSHVIFVLPQLGTHGASFEAILPPLVASDRTQAHPLKCSNAPCGKYVRQLVPQRTPKDPASRGPQTHSTLPSRAHICKVDAT